MCGIDARVIAGKGNGGSKWEDHAWNIVELGGKYYLLDATWDDKASPTNYGWFLKGTSTFDRHAASEEYSDIMGTVSSTNFNLTEYQEQEKVGKYDLNGDNKFTIVDLQRLFEYLSGTVSSIDTEKADVNGDGQVNILDYQALYEAWKKYGMAA